MVWMLALGLVAGPTTIYVAPDDHTDYYWTADGERYRQAFCEMLDWWLDRIDQTAGEPSDLQARFCVDGAFWLREYERARPPAAFERLLARVRDGHISVPLTTLCSTYGGMPTEAVLRGLYDGARLRQQYSLPMVLGVAMENQTQPLGLATLWAGSGIRYTWRGICGCASRMDRPGDREHEVFWWTGLDGSRVLCKWYSMLRDNAMVGGYAEARRPAEAIDFVLGDPEFRRRHPYPIIGLFGQGWDDLSTTNDAILQAARAKTTDTCRVVVSNQLDYFQAVEQSLGGQLPSVTASFGNEWDTYSCSLMETTSRVRRAVERLRGAEFMLALATSAGAGDTDPASDTRWAANEALGLYWDHDWTADGPVSREVRTAWQRSLADRVDRHVAAVEEAGRGRLGNAVAGGPSAEPRYAVVNALSWSRTDVVDLPLPAGDARIAVDLRDARPLPSQRLGDRLRVRLTVPPLGYVVVALRPGRAPLVAEPVRVDGACLDNGLVAVTLAPNGAITSLIDRASGREAVRAVDGRALCDLGPSGGTISVEEAGPLSATLLSTADQPVRHTTRVTLTAGSPRVAIECRVEQNFGQTLTWGFGLNLDDFTVRHEELGAILTAKLSGEGGHYSPRNARYDWLTLNHFVDASSADHGLTLSNADLSFFRLGHSTVGQLDTRTPLLSVLAGGQVDGPGLGLRNQGGETRFLQRFALWAHGRAEPSDALRFSLEHQNPFLAVRVGQSLGRLPATTYSLGAPRDPRAVVWALKPAETQPGKLVARLWNPTSGTVDGRFGMAPPGWQATPCDLVESPLKPESTDARLRPWAWRAWLMDRASPG
ncbi:MAG: glycoside hydrolase [Armatimonadetes bacterium]|nr:glycoside hydrolase [Armatimonadota bacterium]